MWSLKTKAALRRLSLVLALLFFVAFALAVRAIATSE